MSSIGTSLYSYLFKNEKKWCYRPWDILLPRCPCVYHQMFHISPNWCGKSQAGIAKLLIYPDSPWTNHTQKCMLQSVNLNTNRPTDGLRNVTVPVSVNFRAVEHFASWDLAQYFNNSTPQRLGLAQTENHTCFWCGKCNKVWITGWIKKEMEMKT